MTKLTEEQQKLIVEATNEAETERNTLQTQYEKGIISFREMQSECVDILTKLGNDLVDIVMMSNQ